MGDADPEVSCETAFVQFGRSQCHPAHGRIDALRPTRLLRHVRHEYIARGVPGVALEELVLLSGTPVSVDGRIKPSDAPGFGVEVRLSELVPF